MMASMLRGRLRAGGKCDQRDRKAAEDRATDHISPMSLVVGLVSGAVPPILRAVPSNAPR